MGLIPEPSPASIIHYCPKTAIPSVSAEHHSYLLIAKHHHFKETAGNLLGGSICLVAQIIKNLHAMQDTQLWSLGWEDPLEKGIATHSIILAWKIPRTEEPSWLHFMRTQLSDFHLFMLIAEAEFPILWPPDAKSWHIGKDPDAGKDWGQENRMTDGEMVGWDRKSVV